MHFVVVGIFGPNAEAQRHRLYRDWNEHLAEGPIRIAGPLLDERGNQQGWMAVLRSESIEAARAFLDRSPYFEAHLYERVEVYQYAIEVGRLD
jgi:uncharacterized protein YciI